MTSQQFSKYLNDPALFDNQSLKLFENLVARYPYCQSGQLLLACHFYIEENSEYQNQIKKAAAYAGDRCILKDLIGRAKNTRELPPESQKPTAHIPVHVLSPDVRQVEWTLNPEPDLQVVIDKTSVTYERMTQEELLAIVKKRLEEIDIEKKRGPLNSTELAPSSEFRATKASLIEKFIKDEPRISKPNVAFFSPSDSAIRSNFDDEEIVSETLAQLYAQQGNIQKAVHIYKKLSLLNQEKSRFFAAQIEKLNS